MGWDIDAAIKEANKNLKIKITLERKTHRLCLRGMMPLADHSGMKRQQVSLGIYADKAGLKIAVAKAQKMSADLALNRFAWEEWQTAYRKNPETIGEWLARLERDHWNKREKTNQSLTTWKKDYEAVYDKLPHHRGLSLELLKDLITKNSEPGSRSRKRWVLACGKLARFAELDGADTLKQLTTYTTQAVRVRELPTDDDIATTLAEVKNPEYRCVFVLMAVFGLRPHEVFRAEFDHLDQDMLRVQDDSKTGERLAYACWGEDWGEEFRLTLDTIHLPQVNLDQANTALGERISQYWRKSGLVQRIGTAYNLRHCYARRTLMYQWPLELSARSMGHDVAIHTRTYQQFIDNQHFQKLYRSLKKG
ncbi:MAG: hypothetical protein HC924_17665 [Synechococcaceae cyanobacterium SM2_3_2]|nr:hypothetical protein [Synechococcaceae cyanobacterium SM2_3_2]